MWNTSRIATYLTFSSTLATMLLAVIFLVTKGKTRVLTAYEMRHVARAGDPGPCDANLIANSCNDMDANCEKNLKMEDCNTNQPCYGCDGSATELWCTGFAPLIYTDCTTSYDPNEGCGHKKDGVRKCNWLVAACVCSGGTVNPERECARRVSDYHESCEPGSQ